ncbi:amidase [Actinomadura rugatobispora]|uniref:Amidase n=1 Tax=Actinomadura rugatobispora TaxID=1994 RepID=A0ABW0ZY60_9ACTN|nr:hypothetical protein GCM10010200_091210 [Actinomadura rugatobispora]
MPLAPDPLADGGVTGFAARLRRGDITAVEATRAYLDRIAALDGALGAYQHVAAGPAVAAARAVDQALAAGTDLGPLMGVPVSVKDLFAVEGMPTTAGSLVDVGDAVGAEGPFVRRLRAAGCVLLGKTRTVEFALGITGASAPRGTPVNPWDARTPRLPGGSSSGAGVAVAASLCGFAVGADTGGSVRVPAALCGVVGLKTTHGLWPAEGAFPLAPHLDSVGLLTGTAEDAATVFTALTGGRRIRAAALDGLRAGRLTGSFGAEPELERAVDEAAAALRRRGATVTDAALPEAAEREEYFTAVLPARLVGTLGAERFHRERHRMDPVIAARAATGLDVLPARLEALEERRARAVESAAARLARWDACLSPTTTVTAPAAAEAADPAAGLALALAMTRNTQPVNYLGQCAVSLPLPRAAGELPAGLQIACPGGADARLLAVALAVERALGPARRPDLTAFLN